MLVLLHIVSLTHVPLYVQHAITIVISILSVEMLQLYILIALKKLPEANSRQSVFHTEDCCICGADAGKYFIERIDGPTQELSLGSSICACKTLLVMLKTHSLQALQTGATLCNSWPSGTWLNIRIHRSAFSSNAFIPTSLQHIQPLSLSSLDFEMGLLPGCK